ncbi:MAG: response regulator [Nanoarchaeota archaeon]|nr:response regulator [Nanoarchaeota archaeon]
MKVSSLLYVEDDKAWRETIQRQFSSAICQNVETAEDYLSALEMIQRRKYDLIVMDGLEGDCFVLNKELQGMPHGDVVIFSGDDRNKGRAEKVGIPFFKKPNDLDRLIETYKD